MSLESRIASRYLRSRRSSRMISLITLIAVGGVSVGVMALVVVLGVMNGLRNDLREKILVAQPHIHVLTYGEGLRIDNWRSVIDSVMTHPEVVAAAPFVLTQSILRKPGVDYAEGAYVLGIDPDTGGVAVTAIAGHFRTGDLQFRTSRDDVQGGVILGSGISGRMSAIPGDKLGAVSPGESKFSASAGAFMAEFFSFEVVGSFETGMYEYDNGYVVMPLALAQEFAGLGDAVSGIQVRLRDPWRAVQVASELEDLLGGYPYRASGWQEQNSALFSALKLEKLAMGLVLTLVILVAAFNIVSTLTMTVNDKTREIGILRTMGMARESVSRIFLLQGAWIGAVGTTIGTVLGVIVARVIDAGQLIPLNAQVYFIDHLPVHIEPLDLAIVVGASILIAVVATRYPASRAAALKPVDAIRYE